MTYYDDIDPAILEQGTSADQFILGLACGMLFILMINKYIFKNQ
jgi:hypothetical protein